MRWCQRVKCDFPFEETPLGDMLQWMNVQHYKRGEKMSAPDKALKVWQEKEHGQATDEQTWGL